MKKKHLVFKIIAVCLCILILFCAASLFFSKHGLMVSRFSISSDKINSEIRIVQLSDLHNSVFGKNNEKLIQKIEEEEPDLILMTGDMLNGGEADKTVIVSLIERLTEVAPVYVSYGNHEYAYERNYDCDLTEVFENAGATVLEYAFEDLEMEDNHIRIGGIYGYCVSGRYFGTVEIKQEEYDFLMKFTETESYTILMAHVPVCWERGGSLDWYTVDSVWAGHSHGGQIILPFLGGVYAPDRHYFMGREWGVYDSQDGKKHLILSRGLGTNKKIPRMNNIPEIVSVTIMPSK